MESLEPESFKTTTAQRLFEEPGCCVSRVSYDQIVHIIELHAQDLFVSPDK